VPNRAASPVAALALAALAGCGQGRADFWVRGAGVAVETTAPFAHQEDFPERIETTLGAALDYWGGGWRHLAGRTITLTGEPEVACGEGRSLGCFDGDIRLTTVDPGAGTFDCVEQTILVHEVGHAVIGDPLHEDPRWMELEPVARRLGGRRGYGPRADGQCVIWVSVWRHPHGRR